ncbi:TetR/AcrR family transcriptional regulator [Actinomycetospora termitidis]|uniref:TetR/AcrR family transcriptional regulator n=1 Tax=Actinomycetospora termitidis TaxID=3053470 RepID=A0ABT7M8W0_9PSEU|nr:TetR/AcrR family transcriptional regulator [Actinomycetospora sp. Odt1-22]MDL5155863.1 TetR/AcrR family transcriptional regulator [Actinomycetospora sp. Odt1-22]
MEVDTLWTPPTVGRRGRPALTRGAIVEAAVGVADAGGLDAVSMPRLARTVGAAPMSLYRHVPHKEALLALMVDHAIGPAPDLAGTGRREGFARWARANRQVFRAHPWTLPLVTGTLRMGPAECGWAEVFLAHGTGHGLEPGEALVVLMTVNAFVRGASTPIGDRVPSADAIEAAGRGDDYPHLLGLLRGDGADEATDPDDAMFEAGLEIVLGGREPA